MSNGNAYEVNLGEFKNNIKDKSVLVISPGKSIENEKNKVIEKIKDKNIVSISVNFIYHTIPTDYIFVSNLRRYKQMLEYDNGSNNKLIGTSNIPQKGLYIRTQYKTLLNDFEGVEDNATLMLIQYLINLGVKKIYIAGMDGYSTEIEENYVENKMNIFIKKENIDMLNRGISCVLKKFNEIVSIEYITKHKYIEF